MIFVTLGTQDKPFNRLLESVQKEIDKGNIKTRVVVQAVCTKFKSDDMEIFDLIPMDDFEKLMNECDLLITHGGVGSIISGLNKDKKVIAAARLYEYGEHVNNHQQQIIENFSKSGYIIALDDFEKLDEAIKKSKKFKPNKYNITIPIELRIVNITLGFFFIANKIISTPESPSYIVPSKSYKSNFINFTYKTLLL